MKNVTVKERFLRKVELIPFCSCWIWNGASTDRGYGVFKSSSLNKNERAHRYSYKLFNGDIDNNLHVLHKCDTPLCVNPNHLFLGTHEENMKDMKQKKRANGAKGEVNFGAKLDVSRVLEIRNSNMSTKELSNKYKISKSAVERIKRKDTWKHI